MTEGSGGYHNRREPICSKIRSLLVTLANGSESNYDHIAPMIEYWIEYVLREGFATVDELVEGVSGVAWDGVQGSYASVGRFLKEFRDSPHRSEQARSFVSQLCPYVLRWFSIASTEELWSCSDGSISNNGKSGFVSAASFVGHLIEWGLLSPDLVQRHLTKSLTNHPDDISVNSPGATRAKAIYQLFLAAGNTLLRGLLEPDDVQTCLAKLQTRPHQLMGFDAAKLKEFYEINAVWMQRREEQKDSREAEENRGGGGEDVMTGEAPTEVKTPVTFPPQDLPIATIGIEVPSSVSTSGESWLEASTDDLSNATSPTLTISTVSDLTSTEFDEETERCSEKQTTTRHDTLFFEDGNVEIACEDTIFRVHSSVVSFSPSELREVLSQQALVDAPTPEGRPRIAVSDSVEDFAILLKMIYTPGFPARHEVPEFNVFASLLRMTTKYGFLDVRDQLVKDLEGAYPTKWEDFRSAKVLGEDVFGSPKPHPNTVLNLFEAQNVKFAIPFAAYRCSIGGFQALMSDKPGTVLSRRTLSNTTHGFLNLSTAASHLARIVAYREHLSVCPYETCTRNVDINPGEKRMEALEKVYFAMIGKREGGLLNPPSLKHLLCTKCAMDMEVSHTKWGSLFWENLPPAFNLSLSWAAL